MNESMTAVLDSLPPRLRQAAERLWREASRSTEEVTETLRVSYRVLRQVCGEPESLAAAGRLLTERVAAEIGEARDAIDTAYPAATESWQGGGAESFRSYLPRLSSTLRSVADSVTRTAEAVAIFRDGVEEIHTAVVERTELAGTEVAAVTAASRQAPHEAIGPVVDLVEEYSTYVEELATALLDLTSEGHAAGRRLALAAGVPAGLSAAGDGLRLPPPALDLTDLRPAHTQVTLDTAAMARLTVSLSDNGRHWASALGSAEQAAGRLTPEAFGLAGSHFHGDVHTILDRDRGLYATVNGHMDGLAGDLRRATVGYATTEDEIAAELRRGLEDL